MRNCPDCKYADCFSVVNPRYSCEENFHSHWEPQQSEKLYTQSDPNTAVNKALNEAVERISTLRIDNEERTEADLNYNFAIYDAIAAIRKGKR